MLFEISMKKKRVFFFAGTWVELFAVRFALSKSTAQKHEQDSRFCLKWISNFVSTLFALWIYFTHWLRRRLSLPTNYNKLWALLCCSFSYNIYSFHSSSLRREKSPNEHTTRERVDPIPILSTSSHLSPLDDDSTLRVAWRETNDALL